jgi:predicted permease
MVRSFWILSSTDPGFETRDLLTFQVAPEPDRHPTSRAVAAFHQRFLDRIAALPGVQSVGAINNLPLDESPSVRSFVIDDGARAQEQATILAISNFASGGYFRTMGITLQEGRDFNGTDDVRDRGAVIVSRSLADRQWPGRSPLGERVRVDSAEEPWQTVVGVVEDVRPRDLRQPPEPMVYFPFVPPAGDDAWRISSPVYTVRTQDPEQLAGTIREELQAVEPSAPIYLVQTMEWLAARSMARLSFTMLALLVSAVMALLLGAVGLYGVLSYLVGLRTREIGIRLALGARPQDVRRMTLAEGARLTGIGLLLGAAGAAALTRLLAGLLYGIDPLDPYTFAAMTATLLFVGLLASWLPARRASAVDPMRSMRIE